jgi:1,4-alpha-glucan branching enzyme
MARATGLAYAAEMQLLPLDRLGPRETAPGAAQFGLLLPWVSAQHGNRLILKIIHEEDQFLQDIPPHEFPMAHSVDPAYGDYWSAQISINPNQRRHPASAWGTPGTYVYRYQLHNPNTPEPIDWIIDPFAREFGVGQLSAFTLGYQPHAWSAAEAGWRTPPVDQLVMYELMISEFGGSIDGAIARLGYLQDLGINCIEVMPVSNVGLVVDWGFLPIGYFGVDERFGNRKDFQRLVDAAHQRGIAVIVDSVYGHTSESFPYQYVYSRLRYEENPFMGPFAKDYFGCSTDFNRTFTQDFFYTVSRHWLDVYHVDGYRYDCVPNYWDGPLGSGYSNLVFQTYQAVKATKGAGHWGRFFQHGSINLIQCAEQLEGPVEIVEKTYSNCTWQNETLGAARGAAARDWSSLENLGFRLGLNGYPREITVNQDRVAKSALQYTETHDHSRFVCNFGLIRRDNDLLSEGDRALWYKAQPYLIGMMAARGIPMLWQGQEFGENYFVPDSGFGRVMLFRPVRFDYFYDEIGRSVIGLIRKLIRLRRRSPHWRSGEHFFYNQWDRYQSRGVLLFSRYDQARFSLIAVNFSDQDQTVPFWFPLAGEYREELHGLDSLNHVPALEERWITVPSNYGRIWTHA